MKYTRKQILKAFEIWTEVERLTPSQLMTHEECNAVDSDDLAELKTQTLIDYIDS